MAKIALISCTKRKKDYTCSAVELYSDSALFRKELTYAKYVLCADEVYILSAKHGLVAVDTVLEPYNETLNNAKVEKRKMWAASVGEQIQSRFSREDKLFFLCGQRYREFLLPLLQNRGFDCHMAFPSLPIGSLMKWLDEELKKEHYRDDN